MATVSNLDVVKFPLDALETAPLFQGENQLACPRIMIPIPQWGGTSSADATLGQLWPRGQRA